MDLETVRRLGDLVDKFRKSELNLCDTIRNNGFESDEIEIFWNEIRDIVSEIKITLGNEPVLHIQDIMLKKTLIDIRDNNLEASVFFKLCNILKIDLGKHIPGYRERFYDLLEEIHDQVLPNEFIKNKMEIGTIILSQSIPPFYQFHLDKIRDCYCFNFPEAAAIWTRSILEVGIKETLKKRSSPKVAALEKKRLVDLIELCRDSFESSVIEKMENVRLEVNKLLHSKDISKKEKVDCLQVIKDTFQILEKLFE